MKFLEKLQAAFDHPLPFTLCKKNIWQGKGKHPLPSGVERGHVVGDGEAEVGNRHQDR